MPKPIKFNYSKKEPFRDSELLIIVCEGGKREYQYFKFFEGLSSRIKIDVHSNQDGRSAPLHLFELAETIIEDLKKDDSIDSLWLVLDTDQWSDVLHEIRANCSRYPNFSVVQSNPCFEVWLFFHARSRLPDVLPGTCSTWKGLVNDLVEGGFNSDFHPLEIERAIENSKIGFQEIGYVPAVGSTQVWRLAEHMLPFLNEEIEILKTKFPPLVVRDS